MAQSMSEFIAEGLQVELIRLIRKENKIGAGNLVNSISHKITPKGDKITISILANDYMIYVDAGRLAGSFPPVDAIKEWIDEKPITSDISKDSLAFLIGRKIRDEGIDKTDILQKAIDIFFKRNEDKLIELFGDDVEDEIDKMIDALNKAIKPKK